MRRTIGPLEQRSCDAPLKKGEIVPYHRHNQTHPTYCGAGKMKMTRLDDDGKTIINEKIIQEGTIWNSHVVTRAGVLHQLESLEFKKLSEERLLTQLLLVMSPEQATDIIAKSMVDVPLIYHCLFAHIGWDGKVVEGYDGQESAYV